METLDIPGGSARIGVNTNGRRTVVTRRGPGDAILIDLAQRTILATVYVGGGPTGVAFLNGHP